ncbi:hypothetical protein [Microbulbifer celer]|uniref:Uncharacterized protein n=1 Tax=Microbulbifer celer TaxID=435905 RepID=A0ABW3U3B7_9GAMM|nr:hypothetical protein [Microbulbifer celer]UFN58112.1 hypothetical protein LPW13_03420 [Microbulbifer celer]
MNTDLGQYLYRNKSKWEQVKDKKITLTWSQQQVVVSYPPEGPELTITSPFPILSKSGSEVFCSTLRFPESSSKEEVDSILKRGFVNIVPAKLCKSYKAQGGSETYRPVQILLSTAPENA